MLMKNKFIYLCLLLLTVGPLQLWGQIGQYEYEELNNEFVEVNSYPGGSRLTAVDVVKAPGGGFVYGGANHDASTRKLTAFKVDDQNNVIWQKHYGGDNVLDFCSITSVPAGGYALLGTIRIPMGGENETFMLLVRIDANGNEIWSKVYGNTDGAFTYGHEAIATSSGGFALVGSESQYNSISNCNSPFTFCSRAVVLLTDGNGTLLQSRTFAGPPNREFILGHSIAEAKAGGYIITGTIVSASGLRRGYAMRLNSWLGVSWAKEYPITGSGIAGDFYTIRPSSAPNPSGWIISGATESPNGPNAYNVLLDNSGSVIWAKRYPQNLMGNQYFIETIQASSGGYISVGATTFLGMVACKTNPLGAIEWQQIYGTSNPTNTDAEIGGGVLNSGNGGYHFSGIRRLPLGGIPQSGHAYVVKANDQLVSGCNESLGQGTQYDVPTFGNFWTPDVQTEIASLPYVSQLPDPTVDLNILCDFPCGVLSISVSPAGPYCEGDAVTLTSSMTDPANAYAWIYNGAVIGTNPVLDILSLPTGSNQYTLTVTTPPTPTHPDGCTLVESVTIDVNPVPIVSAGHDQILCQGEGTQLNGSANGNPPFTYQWTPSTGLSSTTIANPFCSPPATTTYTLTVIDANGCSASDDVTVTVDPLPNAVFNDPGFLCKGDILTLCVNGNPAGLTYTWTNTSLPYSVSGTDLNCITLPTDPGVIDVSLTVTTPNGCESTHYAEIEVTDCCLPHDLPFPVDYVWNNTSASAEGLPAVLSNQVILINGTFTLDQSLLLDDCKVYMGDDARIDVLPGRFFHMRNSDIRACGSRMWDGIYLPQQSAGFLAEGSQVRDAKNAVVSRDGGAFYIVNSVFDLNRVHVQVEPFAGVHTAVIQSSELVCNGTLLAPYTGMRTLNAISVDQVGLLSIGNSASSNEQNLIRNADYGINAQNSGLKVVNNRFENIDNGSLIPSIGTAIRFEGVTSGASVNLDAGGSGSAANYFSNCSRGIEAMDNVSALILFNVMDQIDFQAIQVTNAGPNSIVIEDNRITEWGQGIICKSMGQSSVTIKRNRLDLFNLTSVPSMLNEGIIVSNQSSAAFAPTVIELNVIRYPQVGIRVEKRPNSYLRQNRIVFDQNDATILGNGYDFSAIVVSRSAQSELRANICTRVISAGPASQAMVGPLTGIRISDSDYSILRYNTLDGFGNGIEVTNQMAGTELECNFLNRCWSGIDFQNATIGDQGSPAANNGNYFYNTAGPFRITGAVSSQSINWYYGSLAANDPNPYNVTNFTDVGGVNPNVCGGGVNGKTIQDVGQEGTPQPEPSQNFEVYPNPSNGMIHITLDGFADRAEVLVSDVFGKVVHRVTADKPQLEIDLTNLSKGMYFIHLDDGGDRITKKLILN